MPITPTVDTSTLTGGASADSRTLSKSVVVLAIEPLNMALSVTGRKAYNVMLWLAQRSKRDKEGFYCSPVSEILRGYGSTTNASKRVQGYIQQMMGTTIVWRPLAAGDEQLVNGGAETLTLDGIEAGAGAASNETRTFPLLAEARVFEQGGQAWVRWFYPPTVQEQLVSPDRWAQLELSSIAKLSTYTAVALYEICARYKDVPGALTTRKPPEFWTSVLREGGGAKPREWRKFKNELLAPAIADINEKTEIHIELKEHRDNRGALVEVQFEVARQIKRQAPGPADVTLVMRASNLGLREEDVDALVTKYGTTRIGEGLTALEEQLTDGKPIHNRMAYLRRILANKFPDGEGRGQGELVSAGAALASPTNRRRQQEQARDAWTAGRITEIQAEFEGLPAGEQDRWIDEAAARLLASTPSPGVRKRLAERDWRSPLIRMAVLQTYATARHGSAWLEPEA